MDLDISIKGGRCKVTEGPTKRVFHTTEELLGLYLLRLNPATSGASSAVKWVDQLGKRGMAVGTLGDKTLTLTVFPANKRTIAFGRGDTNKEYTVTLPDVFMPCAFKDGRLMKALMYIIKPGQKDRLSVTNSDGQLSFYPYGNVYNHGGICWGSTSLRDVRTPDEAYEAFFGSAFNGDLYSFNALGLLNFLNGLKGDAAFPPMADTAYVTSVQTAVQALTRT